MQQTVACRAPLIEVTRPMPKPGGWYGYAPLTSTPPAFPYSCHGSARQRLGISAVGLFVAALLGWWSVGIDRDDGRARRRRWRPHPA
jgi:hypothetical protein